MTSYNEAVAFLESFINYELHRGRMKYNTRALHLRRFEKFLRKIGSPHRSTPFVHIAGTKGKGSTAAILHSIASEAGLCAGLYTSPHLESYCERIRIGRRAVSREQFAEAVHSLRRRLEREDVALERCYRTTFELLTTTALQLFHENAIELGIIETGLGGRLDATNVILPELSVITAIGLDHTHLLGTTHGAIAREKAGIIKSGQPVVVASQPPGHCREVLRVVRKVCEHRGSRLIYAPRRVRIVSRIALPKGQIVRYMIRRSGSEPTLHLPLLGRHQAENLRTALAAGEVLRCRGWPISDDAIRAGVEKVHWPGRLEWLDGNPPLLLDGAHCPLSVEALVETIREQWPTARPVFLFSLLDDKPIEATVAPVARAFHGCPVIVFQARSVRGCPPDVLAGPLQNLGLSVVKAVSPTNALRRAIELGSGDSMLVAFGSLYSIAPLRNAYRRARRREARGERKDLNPKSKIKNPKCGAAAEKTIDIRAAGMNQSS